MRENPFLSLLLAALVSVFCVSTSFSAVTFEEHQVAGAITYDTTPTLGADSISPIVVYTSRLLSDGGYGPGSIYYQRLTAGGAPMGSPEMVSTGSTDDQVNAVSGGRIVYTAYDSQNTMAAHIMLYEIATNTHTAITYASSVREARIRGDKIAWCQGSSPSSVLMLYDISNGGQAQQIAGPYPTALNPEIGERFLVWDQLAGSQRDIYAYDLETGTTLTVSADPSVDEWTPYTSGPWVVWEVRIPGMAATRIEAANLLTGERRVIVDNGAASYLPTINGDLIAYESNYVS